MEDLTDEDLKQMDSEALIKKIKSLQRQRKTLIQSVKDCIAASIEHYDCHDIEELFGANCKMASELQPWLEEWQ